MPSLQRLAYRGVHTSLVAAAVLISVGASSARADVALAPSLMGEDLYAVSGPGSQPGSLTTTSVTCNPNGTSTISFTARGVATGPYTGTYTESGVLRFGPQTTPDVTGFTNVGVVQSLDVSFHIDSPAGTVDGTKTLGPNASSTPSGSTGFGYCIATPPNPGVGVAEAFTIFAQYQADIVSPLGRFRDSGTASGDATSYRLDPAFPHV